MGRTTYFTETLENERAATIQMTIEENRARQINAVPVLFSSSFTRIYYCLSHVSKLGQQYVMTKPPRLPVYAGSANQGVSQAGCKMLCANYCRHLCYC